MNNPTDKTLQDAHLFLEFIDISGTVVSEVPTQVTLPPGPSYTPVTFASTGFLPPFDAQQELIVMAFFTDYQGNILDTAGRPLYSFQADPLPKLAVDTVTPDLGLRDSGARQLAQAPAEPGQHRLRRAGHLDQPDGGAGAQPGRSRTGGRGGQPAERADVAHG